MESKARQFGCVDMRKVLIIFPVAFLVAVSPVLSSFVACACCYDTEEDISSLLRGHAGVEGHADTSHHVDDGEHHRAAHHEHGADHASGINAAAPAYPGASAPNSCSCDQADDPAVQIAAVSQVGKTGHKSTKMTSGHLVSAIKMAEDRLYPGTYAIDAGGVSSPVPHLFLLHRTLLI